MLGLKPKENVTALQKKCDKVLYEQVALRLALEHIRDKNSSIIDDLPDVADIAWNAHLVKLSDPSKDYPLHGAA